jgi:hypothetical protein
MSLSPAVGVSRRMAYPHMGYSLWILQKQRLVKNSVCTKWIKGKKKNVRNGSNVVKGFGLPPSRRAMPVRCQRWRTSIYMRATREKQVPGPWAVLTVFELGLGGDGRHGCAGSFGRWP